MMRYTAMKWFVILVAGFAAFVGFRLAYGYVVYPNGAPVERSVSPRHALSGLLDFEISRKNYAGQKSGYKQSSAASARPAAVDQRYEKVAMIGLASDAFDEDEARIRGVAKAAGALVQFEQAHGLNGARKLQLALGVPPAAFDSVIVDLRAIGEQLSFQVNKTDKTNEYQSLLARQNSLQKSRDSLLALQQREATLADLIKLESSILDLERQIQDLGVQVGEFDSEYEFVTIKLSLAEIKAAKLRAISFMARLKTAIQWAVLWYLGLSAALFFAGGAVFIGIKILQAVKAEMTANSPAKE